MQGALNFHLWLIDIVQSAVQSSSSNTWIGNLASDVKNAVSQNHAANFDSADYLPSLKFHQTYPYKPPAFRFEQSGIVSSTLSSILRLWLHFPSDEASILQLSLIDIVTSKSLSSILFLDKIWEMYSTPFSTVFNVWNARSSKENIAKSLKELQQQFHSHPFATPGSLEYRKLEYLQKLITEWMEINDPGMATMVRRCRDVILKNILTQHTITA